jgi:hypothetical protein
MYYGRTLPHGADGLVAQCGERWATDWGPRVQNPGDAPSLVDLSIWKPMEARKNHLLELISLGSEVDELSDLKKTT